MTKYINKLPAVFQTTVEKKFFDATFDQVLSKKDSDYLTGYLGRRVPGSYQPITDFYIPEPTKDRTWWQLEATAFARNADTTRSNIFFYEDLLEKINYYGGNTLNQDRLFESDYYSFGPPIDYDMFLNYHNYYWINQGLPLIRISGVKASDIIGKITYTTPPTAVPANLTLVSGMTISLVDDDDTTHDYTQPHIVENIGNYICGISTDPRFPAKGIRLVSESYSLLPDTTYEFLPWDGEIETVGNTTIANSNWDTISWDTQPQASNGDYITVERGSIDNNSWSRTNRWFSLNAIRETIKITKTIFPPNARRALRPIIQFTADLLLYKSGEVFRSEIAYGFNSNSGGTPLLRSSVQGQNISTVNSTLSTNIQNGDLVCFFRDQTTYSSAIKVNQLIFRAAINLTTNIVSFDPYPTSTSVIVDNNIVLATKNAPYDGAKAAQNWYYNNSQWQQVFNDKTGINQAPLFQLFDHNSVALDNSVEYPNNSFFGNKIFSYKENTEPGATVDPVLGFPIVYTSLGQIADIVFENNVYIDRYTWGDNNIEINGYYYYKSIRNPILYNSWNLHQPCVCENYDIPPPPPDPVDQFCVNSSKQRVIDKFVVGYGSEYKFKLSAEPYGYPSNPDIVVLVNSTEIKPLADQTNGYVILEINNDIFVDLYAYLSLLMTTKPAQPPVVEIATYTRKELDPAASGYFEIPQQLEANPNQLEITNISSGELSNHFISIIQSQRNFQGSSFGGANNYGDTEKNRSLGKYILQNTAPVLKSMLVSSSDNLDFITALRFSQDEYTKFKNKYLTIASQLIRTGFQPLAYYTNTVVISAYVEEILKTINISKEFSNAFAYSYMIANGTPFTSETHTIASTNQVIILDNYIDLADPKNSIYIYDITRTERLLTIGQDYDILSIDGAIEVKIYTANVPIGNRIFVAFYKNPLPAYIPSTPTKVGNYGAYLPKIEYDASYAKPTYVIIGHDGSRTIAYGQYQMVDGKVMPDTDIPIWSPNASYLVGSLVSYNGYDYRALVNNGPQPTFNATQWTKGAPTTYYGDYKDQLLLELETRIYNLLNQKFRNQYLPPLVIESVKSGYFRETRYTRDEYLDITQSNFNKWAAKNRLNYRTNNWEEDKQGVPPSELWKLYNYTNAIVKKQPVLGGKPYYLPGNWKGIFQYYYDTYSPDTRPWEMLGFSEKPGWWEGAYGSAPYTSTNAVLWQDIEQGIIRQGPRAVVNPITNQPQPQMLWARPGLSNILPVNSLGQIRSVISIFDILWTGDVEEPFDYFDEDWVYGDGSPVEQTWMSSSSYAYSIQEFLYLMRPGPFGELLWDPQSTEISPQVISGKVSNKNSQYVQNESYTSPDPEYAWKRPKNNTQIVHAETVDGQVQIRYGYQRWISDRILFLGLDVAGEFGQKVRTLDVNLANKFAGFTNKDTANLYLESVNPSTGTTSLIMPSNNFEVLLHKSQPVNRYSYSGVIIRALANGTFAVYGYDLLQPEFFVVDRSMKNISELTVGGTPAEYYYFTTGQTYNPGDIVRYNSVYYESLVVQTVQKFDADNWKKLKALPTKGGITVVYKPYGTDSITKVPYGTVLNSVQEVFDLLIGWGDYLTQQGWKFDQVDTTTNQVYDWLSSAKQFLFWLNSNWAVNSSIQLSPLANRAQLEVARGYPDDVESMSNGVYSILDKFGVAISPDNTSIDRENRYISVELTNLAAGGIFFLQVSASETEHIIIVDNTTSFNDIVYSPLLRARQQRLKFAGFRSNNWYGKMEAPGYLVLDNQLVPNFDTIVDSMRYYYDSNTIIDNPSLEALGRSLIGYDSKSYFDNLELSNNVQYLFYQGAIRQKGTSSALTRLFRSKSVQSDDFIEIYEEWALKLGNFGNTIDQVSTAFVLRPEQNAGDVIVARLNYVPSNIGFIKEINIVNAENTYNQIPAIIVAEPDAEPSSPWSIFIPGRTYRIGDIVKYNDTYNNPTYYSSLELQTPTTFDPTKWQVILTNKTAKAYAVLGSDKRISRVDISDPGYGYTKAPEISIDSGTESHALDKLYSVWQGQIIKDITPDNIINIDIDQENIWTVRPPEPSYSLKLPTTKNINYPIPNAGYVNFNDVDWYSFSPAQLVNQWAVEKFDPTVDETIWIAKTFTEDWSVYKLVNYNSSLPGWTIVENDAGELLLLMSTSNTILPQLWPTSSVTSTDFGSMIVLQQIDSGKLITTNNYTVSIQPYNSQSYSSPGTYTDPDTLITYNAYLLVDLDGTPQTAENIPAYENLNTILLYKNLRFRLAVCQPTVNSSGTILTLSIKDPGFGYSSAYPQTLITGDGISGSATISVDSGFVISASIVNGGIGYSTDNVRLLPNVGYVEAGDKVWIDNFQENTWAVLKYAPIGSAPFFATFRYQEPLLDTYLFSNATVYDSGTSNQLVRLPIFDPFKNIIPGPAKQNITYMSQQDPARYNISGDPRLLSNNLNFGENQVGQLWWDLSTTRYTYYEQPMAVDGSETEVDNLIYRRNRWGSIFPGSSIQIYEWTKSSVPPDRYTGSGIPKDVNTYVEISTSNRFTNITEVNYYFWVSNTTDKPNIENRTLTALDVSRLLQNPKSLGFSFFSPIQQTSTNNSYLFYNVQQILAYRGNNVQIEYRTEPRDDQAHTQWMFFREGDTRSLVPDQFWNKMTDSICAYTDVLPISPEYDNGIIVSKDFPWSDDPWASMPWTTEIYGEILPVPDPMLSSSEKYGIDIRPRQGMFVNIEAARKVFVQSANNILKYIPIRDNDPNWNTNVDTSIYWKYTNWYLPGFEDAVPNYVYQTIADANQALVNGQLKEKDIVQVNQGIIDGTNWRFVLYQVVFNETLAAFSLQEIGSENSAIELLSSVYTTKNLYNLSVELRQLLVAFRATVMVDEYLIGQNLLFFAMLNYVASEQKNTNWMFKSSNIYIKENNIPLVKRKIYTPDQIDDLASFIVDSKPYHTQIREYTRTYRTTDIAIGTALDICQKKITIEFAPAYGEAVPGHWDAGCESSQPEVNCSLLEWGNFDWSTFPWDYNCVDYFIDQGWDNFSWDTCPAPIYDVNANTYSNSTEIFGVNPLLTSTIDQVISRENIYTVDLISPDPNKAGLSGLYPYTFDIITQNDPQTFVPPSNIIGVQMGSRVLISGRDYYVNYNIGDNNYTIYFFDQPSVPIPVALVWYNAGVLQTFTYNPSNNEVAYVYPKDSMVLNVDTKLPLNNVDGVLYAVNSWGDIWDEVDPLSSLGQAIIAAGGSIDIPWSSDTNIETSSVGMSYKEHLAVSKEHAFYRNSQKNSGTLAASLNAPNGLTNSIRVFVDPLTHPAGTDILPDPTFADPGIIWINGEKIEYRSKQAVMGQPNTWDLFYIYRGASSTPAYFHPAGSQVFVANDQLVPSEIAAANQEIWSAENLPAIPDPLTETSPNKYTSISNVSEGGLWYANTSEAEFLRAEPGSTV
jgi:hypothetical protein